MSTSSASAGKPHITMWSYLWDLMDDGVNDTLKSMKQDIGLTALSLATHYHTVEHLRPHTRGPFIYRADSSLYFQPDASRWPVGALQHQVAPCARDGGLHRVSDAAEKVGLDLVSWTICCHSSHLGKTYPHAAEQNAFGDTHPESLCPAHPAVQGFLTGLVADLSHNYRISLLELESCHYQGGRHYHHHEKIAIEFSAVDRFLLGLCFNDATKQAARDRGVDADAVQQAVAAAIRRTLDSGEPNATPVSTFIDETPGLRGYVDARVAVVNDLLTTMRDAAASPLSPIVWSGREAGGVDGRDVAEIAGSITIAAYQTDAEKVAAAIDAAVAFTGDPAKVRVGYHTYPPTTPDEATLLRNVDVALERGVWSFTFYHHGIAPKRSLAWVAAAAKQIHAAT